MVDEVTRGNCVLYVVKEADRRYGEALSDHALDLLRELKQAAPLPWAVLSEDEIVATLTQLRKEGLLALGLRRDRPGVRWHLTEAGEERLERALENSCVSGWPGTPGPRSRPSALAERRAA